MIIVRQILFVVSVVFRHHECKSLEEVIWRAGAKGIVSHTESGQHLWTFEEKGNTINSLDVSLTNVNFATSGNDCTLRSYSLATRQLVTTLARKVFTQRKVHGHELRVFAIISSGWDL